MTFRLAGALFLFLYLSLSVAQFASLTIIPKGENIFDITTGVNTLPQGGEVIDKARGIKLSAGTLDYQDGVYINAQQAQAEGFFGLLTTPQLRLDATKNVIDASGGISLNQNGLQLTADKLTLYLDQGVVVLSGNVRNQAPSFEAAHLVIKIGAGYGVLVSPFTYQDSLSKSSVGTLIQLNQIKEADESFSYSISTTLDETVAAELTPYVP
jgi:lipopolysaccharide assembly outer membrane protein LptD (OstA)